MMSSVATRLCRRKRILLIIATLLLVTVAVLYLFVSAPPSENEGLVHPRLWQKIKREMEKGDEKEEVEDMKPRKWSDWKVDYNIHTFYYAWYGNVKFNGKYIHWNHPRMAHWNKVIGKSFSTEMHQPPDDIGANFYPQLGLYSFLDSTAIETHFQQIRMAGIGVIIISWYPPHMSDDHGVPNHYMMERLLHFAHKFRLKVAFHIEDYPKRSVVNLRRHLRYIVSHENLTSHPAYYHRRSRPVYFIYDSYRISWDQWARLLTRRGDLNVRGTDLDGYFLGLYFSDGECPKFGSSGFDGAYPYFGVDGFTPGSRTSNWKEIVASCEQQKVEFAPCVAPGYDDTAVRPWNAANTRDREHGRYYRRMFDAAIESNAPMIGITSFNEWHEGTQIEPAIPKSVMSHPRRTYADYMPNPPEFYLHLTRALVDKFTKKWASSRGAEDSG